MLMVFRMINRRKTLGEVSKLMIETDLGYGQSNSGTTMSTVDCNFPYMIWNIVQTNYQHGTSGIDKARCMVCS